MKTQGSVFRGALLIAGTTIGGGMLALPVLTSLGGFFPSLAIYLCCWMFMTCTGLLFLEVSFWIHEQGNIVSMAKATLGTAGQAIAWIVYLFLFYCLTLAYIVGCGNMVAGWLGPQIPVWAGSLVFILAFGPLVFAGTRVIGKLNVFLMLGLALTFLAFVWLGYPFVNPHHFEHQNWRLSILALPISFASFAYQGTVPTLIHYMGHDPKKSRQAIVIGSFIPLVIYVIWQWLILGIIPTYGPGGLVEALEKGQNAVEPLHRFLHHPVIYIIGQFFAFLALLTSFFGVTLGLVDFLSDGLQLKKTAPSRAILCLIVFLPPLTIACLYPHIFLKALDFAGGIGCALLLGLLPIIMVWFGRYRKGLQGKYTLAGGKPLLLLLLIFVVFELICELYFKVA